MTATSLNRNLLLNNGAEINSKDANGYTVIANWTSAPKSSNYYDFNVYTHSASTNSTRKFGTYGFYTGAQIPGGGQVNSAFQDVNVSDLSASIDGKSLLAHLDAYINSYCPVSAQFLDGTGNQISILNLPVGPDSSTLTYEEASAAVPAGTRKIRVKIGSTSSGSADVVDLVLAPAAQPSALLNVSTRAFVGIGDDVLIGGTIISGGVAKQMAFRAIGPSLEKANVVGSLTDPTLQVIDPNGTTVATNDDWQSDPRAAELETRGLAPSDPRESALLLSLQPQSYTAIVRGKGATGIALVEAYDVDQSGVTNVVNLATRGKVFTGDGIVIGGFVVGGHEARKISARGIGPSLTKFGVSNALTDPQLDIRDSDGQPYFFNDDWQADSGEATETKNEGLAPGSPKEAVTSYMVLPPGFYTVLLSGHNNGTGNGLVEVYDLGAFVH